MNELSISPASFRSGVNPLAPAFEPKGGASSSLSSDKRSRENSPSQPSPPAQKLLILVGVIGTGKSTFATALAQHDPNYVRVCQDVTGSRRACEDLVSLHLSQGKNVIVDRQNFDVAQRRTWVEIGRRRDETLKRELKNNGKEYMHRMVEICVLEFTTSTEECEYRLRRRTSHETIRTVDLAMKLLPEFIGSYVAPTSSEGYDRHLFVQPSLLPLPILPSALEEVLRRLEHTPLLSRQVPPPPHYNYNRGRGSYYNSNRGSSHPYRRRVGPPTNSWRGSGSASGNWRGGINQGDSNFRPNTSRTPQIQSQTPNSWEYTPPYWTSHAPRFPDRNNANGET